MRTPERKKRFKRTVMSSFGAALVLLWAAWTPIPFTLVKCVQLAAAFFLWGGALYLWPRARWILVSASLAATAVLSLPWPRASVAPTLYARCLENYRGVRYVWGGENARGLDCSGLMRRAIMDALWRQGSASRSPQLWREAVGLWWRDCSARAMKGGDGGRVMALFETRDLNGIDAARLQIGDMAVTRSGVHVLAYLGNGKWIEAEPNLVNGGDKVIGSRRRRRTLGLRW